MGILEPHFVTEGLIQKHDHSSNLKVYGLFVGFNAKNSESDSVRSPTSPLDCWIFSSLNKPLRCPVASINEGNQMSHGCVKVGLSILDSLVGIGGVHSDNKNILCGREITVKGYDFGSQVISHQVLESMPDKAAAVPSAETQKNSDVVFEIGEASTETEFRSCSYDSVHFKFPSVVDKDKNKGTRFGCGNMVSEVISDPAVGNELLDNNNFSRATFICSVPVPASDIELSEEYTCVTTHGSHPKVTHIFGDLKVDDCDFKVDDCKDGNSIATAESNNLSCVLVAYPQDDLLKFCHYCNKELDGEDIYMYRGEKAFCSQVCRSEAMKIDLDMEPSETNGISESANGETNKSVVM